MVEHAPEEGETEVRFLSQAHVNSLCSLSANFDSKNIRYKGGENTFLLSNEPGTLKCASGLFFNLT